MEKLKLNQASEPPRTPGERTPQDDMTGESSPCPTGLAAETSHRSNARCLDVIGRGRSERMLTQQADRSDERVLPGSTPQQRTTASARSQDLVHQNSAERSRHGRSLPAKTTSGSLTTTQLEMMEIAVAELAGSCNETDVHHLPLKLVGDPKDGGPPSILQHVKLWTPNERASYQDVCDALNVAVSASLDSQHPLFRGTFEVYAKPMADGIDGAHAMKPSLLLMFEPLAVGDWHDGQMSSSRSRSTVTGQASSIKQPPTEGPSSMLEKPGPFRWSSVSTIKHGMLDSFSSIEEV